MTIGLPVFAGGTGGIGRFAGPTGGYLIGFLPAVFVIGVISAKGRGKIVWDVIAMVVGTLMIYFLGVSWLKAVTGWTYAKALAAGAAPFIIGDAVKIAAAVPIARVLRPIKPQAHYWTLVATMSIRGKLQRIRARPGTFPWPA